MSNYVLSTENKTYRVESKEKNVTLVHGIKHVLGKLASTVISLGEIESEAFPKKERWKYWL